MLKARQQHVLRLKNSLEQLNPKNVLARGYAMVSNEAGGMINNAQQLTVGAAVNIVFEHGDADATINRIKAD
jgi:exodeoxyribonuclease VII large subunit